MANGTKQSYAVKEVLTVLNAQVASVLFSQAPGISRELNLITCAGSYNQSQQTFVDRVIVVSSLID